MGFLPNKIDSDFLDKVRFKPEYYPFSNNFNKSLNQELYKMALSKGASRSALSIISLGEYFNENFHQSLTEELISKLEQLNLPHAELRKLFIALVNEQELLNRDKEQEFFEAKKEFAAVDLHNSAYIREDSPDYPHNFSSFSEILIEYTNHFFKYLAIAEEKKCDNKSSLSEEAAFNLLSDLLTIVQKHYSIKSHYDTSLFYVGEIKILDKNTIVFGLDNENLMLGEKVSVSMLDNQRLKNYNQITSILKEIPIKRLLSNGFSNKTLEGVTVSGGYIKYKLKNRLWNDCINNMQHEIALTDYYPFYFKEPLSRLQNITISKLLQLESELSQLIYQLHKRGFPKQPINTRQEFKKSFVPRIKESVLKSYLKNVTTCSDIEIEEYIRVITMQQTVQSNLYATPLIREEDYYYFPYLTAMARNPYYLVDYWLEEAGEKLAQRGKALERQVKENLLKIKQKDFNAFELIEKSEFKVNRTKSEEIDLLIQTKNTLIVGEIKCVKYPMWSRDYHRILNEIIAKAVKQLHRKCKFLEDNQDCFSDRIKLANRKIIKVVILNYPFYSGVEVEGIPITDITTFTSYFQSNKMLLLAMGMDDTEKIGEIPYYKNEEEFTNNLHNYLTNNPLIKQLEEQLQLSQSSYEIHGLPKIIFTDVISTAISNEVAKD
jgi:hypothetical protein